MSCCRFRMKDMFSATTCNKWWKILFSRPGMGEMAYNRYTNIFKGSHEGNRINCLSTYDNSNFSQKSEPFHPLLRYTYGIYCLLNMLTRLFTWNLTSSCLYTRQDKVHDGNITFVLLVPHSLDHPRKFEIS